MFMSNLAQKKSNCLSVPSLATTITTTMNRVRDFKFTQLLNFNSQSKTVTLLGTIEDDEAILMVEKLPFEVTDEAYLRQFASPDIFPEIKQLENNDVYHWNLATLAQDVEKRPGVKINLIYPASETHVQKYSQQQTRMVVETPELYQQVTWPYIETQLGSRIQWVQNILYHGKEAEDVVYRKEDSFVLLPDMKWDRKNVNSMYLVAISLRNLEGKGESGKPITSIRDLNSSHIEWLKELRDDIYKVVKDKYNVDSSILRVFVHYQPSYYHLHVHVVHINNEGLGSSQLVGKAILLNDVIDDLGFLGKKGYSQKTLTYTLGENHKLWAAIKAHQA